VAGAVGVGGGCDCEYAAACLMLLRLRWCVVRGRGSECGLWIVGVDGR
jgi:hypothetical protein